MKKMLRTIKELTFGKEKKSLDFSTKFLPTKVEVDKKTGLIFDEVKEIKIIPDMPTRIKDIGSKKSRDIVLTRNGVLKGSKEMDVNFRLSQRYWIQTNKEATLLENGDLSFLEHVRRKDFKGYSKLSEFEEFKKEDIIPVLRKEAQEVFKTPDKISEPELWRETTKNIAENISFETLYKYEKGFKRLSYHHGKMLEYLGKVIDLAYPDNHQYSFRMILENSDRSIKGQQALFELMLKKVYPHSTNGWERRVHMGYSFIVMLYAAHYFRCDETGD